MAEWPKRTPKQIRTAKEEETGPLKVKTGAVTPNSQQKVLQFLKRNGQSTVQQLAEAAEVSTARISQITAKLMAEGTICRATRGEYALVE